MVRHFRMRSSGTSDWIALGVFSMLREKHSWWLLAAGVAAVCAGLSVLPYCPPAVSCIRAVAHLADPSSAVLGITLLGSVVVGGSALLTGWTLYWGWRDVERLSRVPPPRDLVVAARRAGVRRLVCLEAPGAAFCAGGMRPTVFISRSLVERLAPAVLEAVLLHEQDHASRYEPLRRTASWAAAQALFFLPVVGWWARRGMETAELRADQTARIRLGPGPVAQALLLLSAETAVAGEAAFTGSAALRTAQLLGDPIPRQPLPRMTVVLSVAGILLTVALTACLTGPFPGRI